MTLAEYKDLRGKSWQEIADDSGVSLVTVRAVGKGMRLELYSVAKAISDSTDGVVTIKELCE
jgi:hypothetical protein